MMPEPNELPVDAPHQVSPGARPPEGAEEVKDALVDNGLELLSEDQCWELLRAARVGRVGLSVRALPVILPVNCQVSDTKILFWTGPGLKLQSAQTHTVVAFEVDGFSERERTGWSVLAVGLAVEVTDTAVLDGALQNGFHPWVSGERTHLVEVSVEFLSGRRIVTAPQTDPEREAGAGLG
jgi:nitroimidazol reductase NimA-like FMN-containing flavoprotein (pyridoxamine 5'-phosphate oxidase superfamily)